MQNTYLEDIVVRPLRRHMHKWKHYIKIYLTKIVCETVDCSKMESSVFQSYRTQTLCCCCCYYYYYYY
jgi:hypothetical protein